MLHRMQMERGGTGERHLRREELQLGDWTLTFSPTTAPCTRFGLGLKVRRGGRRWFAPRRWRCGLGYDRKQQMKKIDTCCWHDSKVATKDGSESRFVRMAAKSAQCQRVSGAFWGAAGAHHVSVRDRCLLM